MDQIYADEIVEERMKTARSTRLELMKIVEQQTTIVDRLAICRLEDTGYRSNGYLITAYAGENADACCIIHGYSDGEIGDKMRPPLSASFYANSFLPGDKIVTTFPNWQQNTMLMAEVTLMLVVAEFNPRS